MVRLPKGTPIFENVTARGFHPPTTLKMLHSTAVTGYARFSFPDAGTIFLFRSGKLIDALLEGGAGEAGSRRLVGVEAIRATFERLAAEEGRLDAYRLSTDLTVAVQALLHGHVLFAGQTLGIVDVRGLLSKVKNRRFTGCLRIYAADRTALIFYHDGTSLGFFDDGSEKLETNPDASQSIARLAGAKLDAVVTPSTDELVIHDLLAEVDLDQLWNRCVALQKEKHARRARQEAEDQRRQRAAAVGELEAGIKEVLVSHLGAPGRQLFDKVLAERVGRSALLGGEVLDGGLADLRRAARLLTGARQTDEILSDVRSVIDTWRKLRAFEPMETWE